MGPVLDHGRVLGRLRIGGRVGGRVRVRVRAEDLGEIEVQRGRGGERRSGGGGGGDGEVGEVAGQEGVEGLLLLGGGRRRRGGGRHHLVGGRGRRPAGDGEPAKKVASRQADGARITLLERERGEREEREIEMERQEF